MNNQNSSISKFIIIIRPEFISFCEDACRAALLNHILFRIAGKAKTESKEKIQNNKVLWYATTEQIYQEISKAWSENKIEQEIKALVKTGLIGRTKNPYDGRDRTKHLYFGKKECRKFLSFLKKNNICFIHFDLPAEVKHLIYSANSTKIPTCLCPHVEPVQEVSEEGAKSKYGQCKAQKREMQNPNMDNAKPKSGRSIYKDRLQRSTTKTDNKERVASQQRALSSSSENSSSLPKGKVISEPPTEEEKKGKNREEEKYILTTPEEVWSVIDQFRKEKAPELPAMDREKKYITGVNKILKKQTTAQKLRNVLIYAWNQKASDKFDPKAHIDPNYIGNIYDGASLVLIAQPPEKTLQEKEQELTPGFKVLSQIELMKLPIEERKAYALARKEYIKQEKEKQGE